MLISILRHGKTSYNLKKILQGKSDIPMNQEGIQEVKLASVELANFYDKKNAKKIKIFCSTLIRCRQSLEIVINEIEKLNIKTDISFDNRLEEMNFGDWEGKNKNNIPDYQLKNRSKNLWTYVIPGGESYQMVYSRVKKFYEENLTNTSHEYILIIGHEKTCQCIDALINNIPPEDLFEIKYINGEIKNYEPRIFKNKIS